MPPGRNTKENKSRTDKVLGYQWDKKIKGNDISEKN